MRVPQRLVSGIVVACLPIAACAAPRRPAAAVAEAPPAAPTLIRKNPRPDVVPRVLRRIGREEQELLDGSKTMAAELPDPTGRARVTAEVNALSAELSELLARLGPGDDVASDVLDDVANKLQLLDTRVSLLFENLRISTDRTTAVLVE